MMTTDCSFVVALLVPLLTTPLTVRAQQAQVDESSDSQRNGAPDERVTQWQRLYRQVAAEWEVELSDNSDLRLTLRAEPVLNWASLDDFNGSVFVWTHDGRPRLIGTIFSHSRRAAPPNRQVVTEFQSLSPDALRLKHEGRGDVLLEPSYRPQPLPDSRVTKANAKLLGLQMRKLAGRFSAHMQRQEERWELRLLPKPLAEYGETSGDSQADMVRAGGIFAFTGFITDPEVLLVLEAQTTDRGTEWFFQPFRFSSRPLFVEFDGAQVWESRSREVAGDDHPPRSSYVVPGSRLMSLAELRARKRGQTP